MRVVALDCVARSLVLRTLSRSSQHSLRALSAPCVPKTQRRVALPSRTCFARALRGHGVAAAEVEEDDEPFEVDLQVTGMMCDGCVAGVTAALKAVPKVVRVTSVDLASGVATCEVKAETMFDAAALTPSLVDAVTKAGFKCTPLL